MGGKSVHSQVNGGGTHKRMEQRSVLAQTTRLEERTTPIRYRWMRYFFTEDVSPDNRPIVDLQQRAIWISLAFILQAVDEIDHN